MRAPSRATPQLTAAYDILAAAHDHPTARQVFERVRAHLPQVSLGTVYRNLEKLRLQGRARVVRLEGGIAHYDARMEAHDHFVCESCGTVVDLPPAPARPPCAELVASGCIARWQTTSVFGTCGACAGGASVPMAAP